MGPLMLATEQGIEVLSLSPWMYVVLLLTSVVSLITAVLALFEGKGARKNVQSLELHVNSRLTELLKKTEQAARGEGIAHERQRAQDQKDQRDTQQDNRDERQDQQDKINKEDIQERKDAWKIQDKEDI